MGVPFWGRGLEREAGPGPCHSSGTGPLPLSPLAHSGSILVSLPPALPEESQHLCTSPSHGVCRAWGALALGGTEHPAPLQPMAVGTVTHGAGDGGRALQKQDPSPQSAFCPSGSNDS